MEDRNETGSSRHGVNTASIMRAIIRPHNSADNQRDKVTISLYSTEVETPPGYNQDFLNQFSNIEKIRDGLIRAAEDAGRAPPEIIISILLVPNWDREHNSYTKTQYLTNKAACLASAKTIFEDIENVKIEDFYSKDSLTTEERLFMHNLKAMGCNADIIKTRAIIDNANACRHLQMDSNTVVPNFKELYNTTFGAKIQKDGINASYYDADYVSAHNKMVYTTPTGDIAKLSNLETHLVGYCREHKDDDNINQDKRSNSNSIYSRVFTKTLNEIKYVVKHQPSEGRTIYPATLDDRVYWLTTYMVTAVNMSWSADNNKQQNKTIKDLNALPTVQIGRDGIFSFQCFLNVIKKHTGDLSIHSKALAENDLLIDPTITGEESRNLLLNISNTKLEIETAQHFYTAVIEKHPEMASKLTSFIPDTPEGDLLIKTMFDQTLTVRKLRENAEAISRSVVATSSPRATTANTAKSTANLSR